MNWQPIETAPYDEIICLLFPTGYIHSGIKTHEELFLHPGTPHERRFLSDSFKPVGISATYSAEAYFEQAPKKWATHS